ncbi:MAG TPA: hypothetical protein VFF60_09105, partial [Candidatus Binatus sp.]|nr:hypothetical protein [Candidatus Binatus sp.]
MRHKPYFIVVNRSIFVFAITLVCIGLLAALACAKPARVAEQRSAVALNTTPSDPSPDAAATPLAHFPIWIYSGCSGEYIKEYNPEQSFPGAARKNADFLENTNSASQSASRCAQTGSPTNQQSCPTAQTPLPGESACVPVVYFTATFAGRRSGCNNFDFFNRYGTTDSDWYHWQRPPNNGNIATSDRYCSGAGAQILVPNSADFQNWLTTNRSSPMSAAPANQVYFRDDVYSCYSSSTCIGSLVGYASQRSIAECADDACALAAENALNVFLAPRTIYLNSLGGAGLGF